MATTPALIRATDLDNTCSCAIGVIWIVYSQVTNCEQYNTICWLLTRPHCCQNQSISVSTEPHSLETNVFLFLYWNPGSLALDYRKRAKFPLIPCGSCLRIESCFIRFFTFAWILHVISLQMLFLLLEISAFAIRVSEVTVVCIQLKHSPLWKTTFPLLGFSHFLFSQTTMCIFLLEHVL